MSPSALDKPFAKVAAVMKLKKHITPKAMRRTFQDLARAAQVNDVVTRAVLLALTCPTASALPGRPSVASASAPLDSVCEESRLVGKA